MCKINTICSIYFAILVNCALAIPFSIPEYIEIAQFRIEVVEFQPLYDNFGNTSGEKVTTFSHNNNLNVNVQTHSKYMGYDDNCTQNGYDQTQNRYAVQIFPENTYKGYIGNKTTGDFSTPSGIKQPIYSKNWKENNPYVVNHTLSGSTLLSTNVIISPLITNITVISNNTFAVWDVPANTPLVYIDMDNWQGLVNIYIDRTSTIAGQFYDPTLYCTIPEPCTSAFLFTGILLVFKRKFIRWKKD
jgi:hypothetical protein